VPSEDLLSARSQATADPLPGARAGQLGAGADPDAARERGERGSGGGQGCGAPRPRLVRCISSTVQLMLNAPSTRDNPGNRPAPTPATCERQTTAQPRVGDTVSRLPGAVLAPRRAADCHKNFKLFRLGAAGLAFWIPAQAVNLSVGTH